MTGRASEIQLRESEYRIDSLNEQDVRECAVYQNANTTNLNLAGSKIYRRKASHSADAHTEVAANHQSAVGSENQVYLQPFSPSRAVNLLDLRNVLNSIRPDAGGNLSGTYEAEIPTLEAHSPMSADLPDRLVSTKL